MKKRIPFEVSVDCFYSASDLRYLERVVTSARAMRTLWSMADQ